MSRTRYALRRHDGCWFSHPTDTNTEWSASIGNAHLWVDIDACVAAAFIRGKLRCEEVSIQELTLTPEGLRIQPSPLKV